MSLAGRLSAFYLGALGLVLLAFSAGLYAATKLYLERRVAERLDAALDVLAAAAEVHPDSVEWEPQERVLPLGQEGGEEHLRWMIFDDRGRRVDRSRNLDDADLTPEWTPRPASAGLPPRLIDRRGRAWQVARRRIVPGVAASGSRIASDGLTPIVIDPPVAFYPALELTACAPLGPVSSTLSSLIGLLAALGSTTWLVSALACRRLVRRALDPLRRLASSARGLDAADPGWSLATVGTLDELQELGRAFNDLLARLHVAYERQRRFAGDASHQLRTPLTVLIGQLEVALRRDRTAEEYRRALRSALGGAEQLGRIVEALLFLGRAEEESSPPECEPIDLARWAGAYLGSRTGEVELLAPRGLPAPVRAHPHLLAQALENLLDNASKHGGAGASARVEVRIEGPDAVLAVEDDGPGLPSEEADRVFEPFHRAPRARRGGIPGVGLGLAVVRRIAAASGGTVRIRSAPGAGFRAEVRLPLATGPLEGSPRPAEVIPPR